MLTLKKKPQEIKSHTDLDGELRDRLFFHDIINQTHGLLLYLGQREIEKSSVPPQGVKMLASEIKTLQSLIRDHYDFKHKNLSETLEWVPFTYAKVAYAQLSLTYLTQMNVSSSFKMEEGVLEGAQIYYPCFYRIMNNLIKNMAEAHAESVEFEFTLKETGLFIRTKNVMRKNSEEEIPERNAFNHGLGLESIHHLAEENGGSFSYEISHGTWINRLFLPIKAAKSDKIAA